MGQVFMRLSGSVLFQLQCIQFNGQKTEIFHDSEKWLLRIRWRSWRMGHSPAPTGDSPVGTEQVSSSKAAQSEVRRHRVTSRESPVPPVPNMKNLASC